MDPKLLEELRQKYIKNPTEDMTAKLVEKPSKDSFESSIYSKDELRELFMAFVGDPLELAVMLASFLWIKLIF